MTNAIAAAIEPLRDDAITAARQEATRITDRVYTNLAARNWDINAAYPYPYDRAGRMPRNEYERAKAQRALAESLTVRDESKRASYKINDPYFVVADDGRAGDFVQFSMLEAGMQFDAYVNKLTKKVEELGPVVSAEITEHAPLWCHSVLTCTHESGEVSRWKTKQIVNVSKLGKLFNQWPTHRIK